MYPELRLADKGAQPPAAADVVERRAGRDQVLQEQDAIAGDPRDERGVAHGFERHAARGHATRELDELQEAGDHAAVRATDHGTHAAQRAQAAVRQERCRHPLAVRGRRAAERAAGGQLVNRERVALHDRDALARGGERHVPHVRLGQRLIELDRLDLRGGAVEARQDELEVVEPPERSVLHPDGVAALRREAGPAQSRDPQGAPRLRVEHEQRLPARAARFERHEARIARHSRDVPRLELGWARRPFARQQHAGHGEQRERAAPQA